MRRMTLVIAALAALAALAAMASVARAHSPIMLSATLDTAQEVPAPTGTNPGAGGTATFTFDDESGRLDYDVTLNGLTSDPLAGHIHQGAVGVPGDIVVTLPVLPTADGQATSHVNLPENAVQALFNGELYVNFHTTANQSGEVRGQIRPTGGACSCTASDFKSCVKAQIKGLEKSEKKEAGIRLLKKLVKKSKCGSDVKKKKVGCCLPGAPEEDVVSDRMCGMLPAKACTKIGGVSRGTGSSCLTACSPSGAFLDAASF